MLKILLSGGGTLGSVSPLIAIKESFPDADYLFIGTKTGPERFFVEQKGIRFKYIWTSKFRRYISVLNIVDIFKFPLVVTQALYILAQYRPDIILTSGGFVSVPIALAGKLLGITIFMHQQDVTIGLANRMLKNLATIITVTFPDQLKYFPKGKTFCTGNPVRPLEHGHIEKKKLILILGGSLGAQGLNTTVNQLIPALTADYQVVHVLGKRNFYQRLSLDHNYMPVNFLTGDFVRYVQEAELVITRAGMSTLTELAEFGKPTIVIPMPESHQVDNARFLSEHHAALAVDQLDKDTLQKNIRFLLDNPSERTALGNNLAALFPRHANQNYVALIKKYAKRKNRQPVAYLVGIGGIGISSLAYYFQQRGYRVMGSDIAPNEITRRLSGNTVDIFRVHDKQNLPIETAILIYSSAVPTNNEEIEEAKRRHLAVYSYNEYLGVLSGQFAECIAVTGTHGKTTTTAMTGLLLRAGRLDPTIIVGSLVPQLEYRNYHEGGGKIMVVEACEYRSHMLLLDPSIVIITNIEKEHLDYYRDLDQIKEHFQRFVDKLPAHGILIKNADDPALKDITSPTMITFGLTAAADYYATNIHIRNGRQYFDVMSKKERYGQCSLQIPGAFNILNALAALVVADHYKLPRDVVVDSLASYQGSWRRFEKAGEYRHVPVYSDYAHHPTEIRSTLAAIRSFYPDKRLVLLFQPHSFDRTEKLFSDFVHSFTDADLLVLTEVYDVAGRDHQKKATTKKLFDAVEHPHALYAESLADAKKILMEKIQPHDILIVMGAGDVDSLARELVKL